MVARARISLSRLPVLLCGKGNTTVASPVLPAKRAALRRCRSKFCHPPFVPDSNALLSQRYRTTWRTDALHHAVRTQAVQAFSGPNPEITSAVFKQTLDLHACQRVSRLVITDKTTELAGFCIDSTQPIAPVPAQILAWRSIEQYPDIEARLMPHLIRL